jgi:hypothetical protein
MFRGGQLRAISTRNEAGGSPPINRILQLDAILSHQKTEFSELALKNSQKLSHCSRMTPSVSIHSQRDLRRFLTKSLPFRLPGLPA